MVTLQEQLEASLVWCECGCTRAGHALEAPHPCRHCDGWSADGITGKRLCTSFKTEVPEEREVVECDEHCGAFVEPETLEEYRAALEHWKFHGRSGSCSHGC